MKILHLIASVDPEHGGPFEYARIMAQAHQTMGHETSFITLDEASDSWVNSLEFNVYAAGPALPRITAAKRYNAAVREAAQHADVAIIHGLWHVASMAGIRALQNAGVPWVTFSHGMMDPYFKKSNPMKHWLKQATWSIVQGYAFSKAYRALFTCQEEQRLAKGSFIGHSNYTGEVVAFCASDLVTQQENPDEGTKTFRSQVPDLGDRSYLLFLGRIHPKKACDNLIKAFAEVAKDFPEIDLVFAGPDQVGWQNELETLAKDLGVPSRIHWAGMTAGHAKVAAFSEALAFVLPSHQENFGIVVAEALSVGTPVLISHKVNIWREIIEDNAGLACEDTVVDTERMLREYLSLSSEESLEFEASARPCYVKRFSIEAAATDLETVLKAASLSQ